MFEENVLIRVFSQNTYWIIWTVQLDEQLLEMSEWLLIVFNIHPKRQMSLYVYCDVERTSVAQIL